MNKLFIASLFLLFFMDGYSQAINPDYKSGALNIALPKTPESQGFENYGNIPVNDVTGTANVSIPIYNLKSRFLTVPITLSYNATGIKVNQEASWAGLGFDLIAGGRITVDVKGAIDDDGVSQRLFSPTQLVYGMQKLFHRLGDSSGSAIYTFASTCHECDTSLNHNIPDDEASINAMAEFGLGEPDIFHANFLGQSLTFYFDKINGATKFIGEKSLVSILENRDSNSRITDWTITDNLGIKYYFAQKESTELSIPSYISNGGLYGTSSTTGWLLTKILHPSGDSINFSYTNYGSSYPAFTWSASVSSPTTVSNDAYQTYSIQSPMYLTKIESSDAEVDFKLGNRLDIRGAGSKRLDTIKIIDKESGAIRKKVFLSYDYFTSSQATCYSDGLDDSLKNYALLRLRLAKLFLDDSTFSTAPYKFYYYGSSVTPNKYSFAQDHWGYYNGESNNYYSCSPQHLIPAFSNEIITSGNDIFTEYLTFISYGSGYAANRDYSASDLPTMTLDSVVYPTGGSTKLVYEAQDGSGGPTGGGLRIKTTKNYSLSKFSSSNEYTYGGGVFMGLIRYQTVSYGMNVCPPGGIYIFDKVKGYVSSSGYTNDNDFVVIYSSVTEAHKDSLGKSNGYVAKSFYVSNPRSTTAGVNGYISLGAHWPTEVQNPEYNSNTTTYLYPGLAQLPPTPVRQLDGKLSHEEYFDSSNILLKSIDYYYHQADYTNNFYSIRAIDNRPGGNDAVCSLSSPLEFEPGGQRRFSVFVSPAKSYFTLTDSVIEKTYQGSNFITHKKSFNYNKFYQPEFETEYNSDGTQTISYTKLLSGISDEPLNYPMIPSDPDSHDMLLMRLNHVYELPIEKTILKRSVVGDTSVLNSRFVYYNPNTLPKKSFALENNIPLSYRSQFVPAYFLTGGSQINVDGNYKFQDSVSFSSASLITELRTRQGINAYIWDDYHNHLLAQCINAGAGDIAYSSFETSITGNWSYSGSTTIDLSSPTGQKAYNLSGGNITKSGLVSATYIVSYWGKSGSANVNSAGPIKTGRAFGNWAYYEHEVTGTSITVSGSNYIDELRLYPKGTTMTTYTYKPLVGISSQCDANNKISYYEYDTLSRLVLIRDQDKNIIRQICYNYAGQAENCHISTVYINADTTQNFTKNNCGSGLIGTVVPYRIPQGKYSSAISQHIVDSLVAADFSANGQSNANTYGSCVCDPTTCTALGADHKCVNGNCETGIAVCVSSVFDSGTGIWTCTWYYRFSDCLQVYGYVTHPVFGHGCSVTGLCR
jgi:hypothetical protein